jgi:hypothetical protein
MATGQNFRKRCEDLATAMGWAVILLGGAILFDAAWEAGLKRIAGHPGGDLRDTFQAVGVELAKSAMPLSLVGALWTAERVFARMARGEVLADANAAGLAECGRWVQGAATAGFIITPTVLGWISFSHRIRVDFEWTYVALFLFGVALTLLGDVLSDAAAARKELDEIV